MAENQVQEQDQEQEQQGIVYGLQFHGRKEKSNLQVSYTLFLPASAKELETFLKAAKKFTGKKEVEIAEGLHATYIRGGDIGGKIVGTRKSVQYDLIVDAINEYFDVPEDETLIYEDVAEGDAEEDDSDDNGEDQEDGGQN